MPGLAPGIHFFRQSQDVDGRDKPGHDGNRRVLTSLTIPSPNDCAGFSVFPPLTAKSFSWMLPENMGGSIARKDRDRVCVVLHAGGALRPGDPRCAA
jgi:hypothetical protein